jgi:hypothetical protein
MPSAPRSGTGESSALPRRPLRPRLGDRARLAAAAALLAAALGIAVLRVGVLTHVGGLRLGAPAAMNDFYSSVYYPVRAFLDGENPHDRVRLKALYPKVEEYPPYLPFNLALYLPFGLLPPATAAIAYFVFTAALTIPLSMVALRLAAIDTSPWRVTLVAALLLLSRPGHWTLISGQHAVLLALLAYLALLLARRSPLASGMALGLCMYKPSYGVPLAVLMLVSGYASAVGIGALLATGLNAPLVLLLASRAGGIRPFLEKLSEGYHYWQHLPGMDPGSSLDPMSFNQLDAATFVSRLVGHAVPWTVSLLLTALVLGVAGVTLRRLANAPGRTAEQLSTAVVCLGTLVAVYHMTYDIVLLTAPLAALLSHGLPRPVPRSWGVVFALLFAVPCLNWALTYSALQAWRPSHHVWIAVASVNTACLLALFAGYVAVARVYARTASGPPASAAVSRPDLLTRASAPPP